MYVLSLLFLLTFFVTYRMSVLISQINTSNLWRALVLIREGWIFKMIMLQLAGLPPMFIFFIKFGFIVTAFTQSSFIICVLGLTNLIAGMIFYLQLFKLTSSVVSKDIAKSVVRGSSIKTRSFLTTSTSRFYFACASIVFLVLNWLSALFFMDIYVLFSGLLY